MNKKKLALIGLASATCLALGGFALTACNEQTDTRDSALVAIYNAEKEAGTTDKEYDAWLVEKFTALNGKDGADGTDGTDGKDGKDGVSITYIGKLGDEYVAYFSDGTTQVIPVINTTLAVGDNSIDLNALFAKSGVAYKFTSDNGGIYTISTSGTDVYVYGDDADDPYLDVNQYNSVTSYTFSLEAGKSITFNCQTNSFEAGKYTLNIEEAATLSQGSTEIELTDDNAADGVVYAFVAPKDGVYKFSITEDSNAYIYGSDKYTALLEADPDAMYPEDNTLEYQVTLKKGEFAVLHCKSFDGEATIYEVAVTNAEPDKINAGDAEIDAVIPAGSVYYADLTVTAAGTYTLNLNPYANGSGNIYTITVDGQDYTVQASDEFKLDLQLSEGTTSISIKTAYSSLATLRLSLTAKA